MLAAMAVSSMSSVAIGSGFKDREPVSAVSTNAKNKTVTIDAKPEPIAIQTSKTAIIVVDMQNDFGTKGGMFDLAGIDISMIQKAVSPTAKVLTAARESGIKIIYLKMGYRPDLSDLGTVDSVNRTRHLQFMHVGKAVRAPDHWMHH